MNAFPWLSLLTALPVVGAGIVLVAGTRSDRAARFLSMGFAVGALCIALLLWHGFDVNVGGMQFVEQHAWVPALHIQYHLGIDGLGLSMLVLSAIVTLISLGASWKIEDRVPLYFALILLVEACLFGAFTALNFVHWFTFWELCLIPAFFLIKIWGGPRRTPAATQFLVYTMAGSVAMLLSFLAMYLAANTFEFEELGTIAQGGRLLPSLAASSSWMHLTPEHLGLVIFGGVFLGFAVKVPVIPFHTWLPDTYAEAPTGTTILLTGAMSKMGLYGFLRILIPIFAPQMQSVLTPLLWMTVATVVLGSLSALAQTDLKRIFAYSSINHLGYCLLGIFAAVRYAGGDAQVLTQQAAALSGTVLQMFNHGITAATIFWFVAILETRSGGARELSDFGGLRRKAPVLAGMMGISLFSSLGLPGLNGFISEFLIFKGAFPLVTWATALCTIGLLITAVFILNVIQRVFTGPLQERHDNFMDLSGKEQMLLAPAIALMFLLGLDPQILLSHLNATVLQLTHTIKF
jgi:NADH-quinone oxidoreductase subunit M